MKNIVDQFYTALKNLNGDEMANLYHKDINFEDPAFGKLNGEKAKNMWRMLCKNGKDLTVDFSNLKVGKNNGSAHWEAHYTFSKTGRKVHNRIDAEFEFKDGLIIKHIDTFDLHKWARQAIGFKGLLLGGTSFFKRKLNQQTNHLLSKFESEQHEK